VTATQLVSIIVPVFNERENVELLAQRVREQFAPLSYDFELLFVNDGSTDDTAEVLQKMGDIDPSVKVITFSRNFGHQPAVTAGIDHCQGDCAIIMDADLQDPPEVVPRMVRTWEEGYDVVYATRTRREGEGGFKRITAKAFYRILNSLTDIKIPLDTGDFRLIDRKVINVLKEMPEYNRFIRGMVAWVGFRQTSIEYERKARHRGETKYSLAKMLRLALNAITAFSYRPLQIATYTGAFFAFCAFLSALYILVATLVEKRTVPGWSSLMVVVLFLGGVQLMTLGIMGEYIGRILEEIKKRPHYVIDSKQNVDPPRP